MAMVVAGFTRRRSGGAAARDGLQAIGQAHAADRDAAARRAWRRTASRARPRIEIVLSITSFALYGFPESHAASFALIVYASAYLKAHFPGGVLHRAAQQPADGVLLTRRRSSRTRSGTACGSRRSTCRSRDWNCFVQDGRRDSAGAACTCSGLRRRGRDKAQSAGRDRPEALGRRSRSIDELVARAGLRQDELRTLAEIGALASFGGDRRTALWQAERAGRPAGPLLDGRRRSRRRQAPSRTLERSKPGPEPDRASPLPAMSLADRVRADYDGTGLTIGPHPMALVRASLATRGVRARDDLLRARAGPARARGRRRASCASVPARPKDLSFSRSRTRPASPTSSSRPTCSRVYKRTIVDEPYLLVEGVLQNQDGAVSVKADRVDALRHSGPDSRVT